MYRHCEVRYILSTLSLLFIILLLYIQSLPLEYLHVDQSWLDGLTGICCSARYSLTPSLHPLYHHLYSLVTSLYPLSSLSFLFYRRSLPVFLLLGLPVCSYPLSPYLFSSLYPIRLGPLLTKSCCSISCFNWSAFHCSFNLPSLCSTTAVMIIWGLLKSIPCGGEGRERERRTHMITYIQMFPAFCTEMSSR